MRYLHPSRMAVAAVALLFATPAWAQARGESWRSMKAGDRAELDVACSGHWEPVTITRVDPVEERSDLDYTVRRADGNTWSFRAPGIVAPCGRAAGGTARERAAFAALPTGVYGCTYRGQPVPAMEFALLSASVYRDRDGGRGTYRVDPRTRVLEFVTGPMRGARAQQITPRAVHVLNSAGVTTGNVCAHNPSRNPNAPHL
jgi:hypothetical protein